MSRSIGDLREQAMQVSYRLFALDTAQQSRRGLPFDVVTGSFTGFIKLAHRVSRSIRLAGLGDGFFVRQSAIAVRCVW